MTVVAFLLAALTGKGLERKANVKRVFMLLANPRLNTAS